MLYFRIYIIIKTEREEINLKRNIIVTALVVGAMLVSTSSQLAFAYSSGAGTFSKKFIAKDEYKKITTVNKGNSDMSQVGVLVTTMYDGNGNKANDYMKSKTKFMGWNGSKWVLATSKDDEGAVATKGKILYVQLKNAYIGKGKSIQYHGQGNNPRLNAYISGTFYADGKR